MVLGAFLEHTSCDVGRGGSLRRRSASLAASGELPSQRESAEWGFLGRALPRLELEGGLTGRAQRVSFFEPSG